MSRYDQPSEPDLDQYETRTDDIDVPDFDQPEWPNMVERLMDPPVDPAEHCVQAITSALKDLEAITAANEDLSRAFVLRQLLHKAWMAVSKTDEAMIVGLDRIMERRR